MVCEVVTFEIKPGEAWGKARDMAMKSFKFERDTLGQRTHIMVSRTGKTNRIIAIHFHESMAAHEEYTEKLFSNPEYTEIVKGLDFNAFVVQGTSAIDYYNASASFSVNGFGLRIISTEMLFTRRTVIDSLFGRLVNLFRGHQNSRSSLDGSTGVNRQRKGCGGRIVWKIRNAKNIILTKGIIETFHSSSHPLDYRLNCRSSTRATLFE